MGNMYWQLWRRSQNMQILVNNGNFVYETYYARNRTWHLYEQWVSYVRLRPLHQRDRRVKLPYLFAYFLAGTFHSVSWFPFSRFSWSSVAQYTDFHVTTKTSFWREWCFTKKRIWWTMNYIELFLNTNYFESNKWI